MEAATRPLPSLLRGAFVAVAIGVLAFLDVLVALSALQRAAYIAISLGLVAAAAILGGTQRSRAWRALLIAAAAVLIGLLNYSVEKRFLRSLQSVRPAMTEAQARQLMQGFPEGTGWPSNPLTPAAAASGGRGELRLPGKLVFRPTDEPGDSNWGVITLDESGLVVSVEFWPD